MWEEPKELKKQISLLDYLKRHNWSGRQVGYQQEVVGLCPLHKETRPSFYVNTAKDLFYCHGCQRGGDLIRFMQFYFALPFKQTIAHLRQELDVAIVTKSAVLGEASRFYQSQLHRHGVALEYLRNRGLCDTALIDQLGVGYAPGGCLRRQLSALGYSFEMQRATGLISSQGRDTFYRRLVFPSSESGRVTNIYGRSISGAPSHRFLPGSKGGLFAWDKVSGFPAVILVEGLFDLAVLWQAGFLNTTCSFGTNLTPAQFAQLCDKPGRRVFVTFDADANKSGQRAASTLTRRLKRAGLTGLIVQLPEGHDPNSYFGAGASTADFVRCLNQAVLL